MKSDDPILFFIGMVVVAALGFTSLYLALTSGEEINTSA